MTIGYRRSKIDFFHPIFNLLAAFHRNISVDDCAKTEILVCAFDAVFVPGTVPGPETASNAQTSISVMTTEPIKIPLKVAFSALF